MPLQGSEEYYRARNSRDKWALDPNRNDSFISQVGQQTDRTIGQLADQGKTMAAAKYNAGVGLMNAVDATKRGWDEGTDRNISMQRAADTHAMSEEQLQNQKDSRDFLNGKATASNAPKHVDAAADPNGAGAASIGPPRSAMMPATADQPANVDASADATPQQAEEQAYAGNGQAQAPTPAGDRFAGSRRAQDYDLTSRERAAAIGGSEENTREGKLRTDAEYGAQPGGTSNYQRKTDQDILGSKAGITATKATTAIAVDANKRANDAIARGDVQGTLDAAGMLDPHDPALATNDPTLTPTEISRRIDIRNKIGLQKQQLEDSAHGLAKKQGLTDVAFEGMKGRGQMNASAGKRGVKSGQIIEDQSKTAYHTFDPQMSDAENQIAGLGNAVKALSSADAAAYGSSQYVGAMRTVAAGVPMNHRAEISTSPVGMQDGKLTMGSVANNRAVVQRSIAELEEKANALQLQVTHGDIPTQQGRVDTLRDQIGKLKQQLAAGAAPQTNKPQIYGGGMQTGNTPQGGMQRTGDAPPPSGGPPPPLRQFQ